MDLRGEPLAQRLFAVGFLGGQADDAGRALQGQVGFRGQGQKAFEEMAHGNFTWGPGEKAGAAGQSFRRDVLEPGGGGGQLLLEEVEKTMGVGRRVDMGHIYSRNTIYE